MSTDGQGTLWRRNIAENFNRLSRAHERYRRQTDDRQQTDGRWHIANMNLSSRSLKTTRSCLYSSGQNTGTWRTDRQSTRSYYSGQHCEQCGRAVDPNNNRIDCKLRYWSFQYTWRHLANLSTTQCYFIKMRCIRCSRNCAKFSSPNSISSNKKYEYIHHNIAG